MVALPASAGPLSPAQVTAIQAALRAVFGPDVIVLPAGSTMIGAPASADPVAAELGRQVANAGTPGRPALKDPGLTAGQAAGAAAAQRRRRASGK